MRSSQSLSQSSYLVFRGAKTLLLTDLFDPAPSLPRVSQNSACAVTIRIVVGFAVMAFAFKFDFPPFMVLIIAILNDGTIMTLSVDRVLPSSTPDSWDLAEM